MVLGQQLQRSLSASPHHHEPGENGEIFRCAPAALATTFHDFFQVTTIAVVEGRAVSGMMTTSACSAWR